MTWHVEHESLERYALGLIDEAGAYSVETHVMTCPSCRTGMAGSVPVERLDGVWGEIIAVVDSPRRGVLERLLTQWGVPDHVARLLGATPSLQASWFLAVGLALTFAIVAAHAAPEGEVVFLGLAPLIPLAGVAAAYGPGVDPTYEIGLAAPMRSFRLALIRGIAVLTSSMALAAVGALTLPRLGWVAAAWLLPSVALCAASLALSTFWPAVRGSIALAVGWIVVVVVGELAASTELATFRGSGQIAFLVVILLAAGVLVGRREAFDARRTR